MKNAPKHQKRFTTAKNAITFTSSKTSIVQSICRALNGTVDAFTCAVIKTHMEQSTEAGMAGHWPHAENQSFLNHLISKYYNV